ncbi:MAG: hypothetical protein F6K62_12420 [Sphaerospermopsis sp. SIO1G2]|nr:hypothetical protein [Sphaerospermopsis sp. SIO1G2]
MKRKVIVSSMLLGLLFPVNNFANALTPASIAHKSQDNSHTLNSVRIARRIPQPNQQSSKYVASALRSYPSRIFNIARELSGNRVRWESVYAESAIYNDREAILLTIGGKVPIKFWKDPWIVIEVWGIRNNNGEFNFVHYKFYVNGGSRIARNKVKKEARRRLRNLPRYYPRFNRTLNLILRCRLQKDTGYSYGVSQCRR